MIKKCDVSDVLSIYEIVNDAAEAYKDVIPDDCWHEPYMSEAELRQEFKDGVEFWSFEDKNSLIGIMGIQDKGDVALIRHAYIKSDQQQSGHGSRLLKFLESTTQKPILVGTWTDATWAITFYQKNGYNLVSKRDKDRLLRKYWTISERQLETSVVLTNTLTNV